MTTPPAELIERLEKAQEGSRELDAAIRFVVAGDMTRCNYEERCWCENAGKPDHDNENGCGKWLGLYDERTSYPRNWEEDVRLPHYTTSLDAALSLVPEGMCWWIESEDDGPMGTRRPSAVVAKRGSNPFASTTIFAATPALALTIAALKAKESTHDR